MSSRSSTSSTATGSRSSASSTSVSSVSRGSASSNAPKKILRIALAMGGGVSLGTFSAAALVETLRVLRIGLSEEFSGFHVDALSGASAGSITLAVMLHGLLYADAEHNELLQQQKANPEDAYVRSLLSAEVKNEPAYLAAPQQNHADRLFKVYQSRNDRGDYTPAARSALVEDLWRLQKLEETMNKVWFDLLNVEKLATASKGKDAQSFHGLLNFSGAVDEAGTMFLNPKPACAPSPMLGGRVLTGFTITNLSALPAKYHESKGDLTDGAAAPENRGLRVFDLRLHQTLDKKQAVGEYRKCTHFLLVHNPTTEQTGKDKPAAGPAVNGTANGNANGHANSNANVNSNPYADSQPLEAEVKEWGSGAAGLRPLAWEGQRLYRLASLETWSMMLATAVASAAFPGAFEPVTLTRFRHEMPRTIDYGRWPVDDVVQYPFTYVDGGVFNNEPVREAFRMAALLDQHSHDVPYERIVLSIDPNISTPSYEFPLGQAPNLTIPIHALGAQYPNLMGAISSLEGVVGSVTATLSREDDKVSQQIRVTERRNDFSKHIGQILALEDVLPINASGTVDVDVKAFVDLRPVLISELERQRRRSLIPPQDLGLYAALVGIARGSNYSIDEEQFRLFFDGKVGPKITVSRATLSMCVRCVMNLLVNLLLDLTTNQKTAKLLGIAPMWYADELEAESASLRRPRNTAAKHLKRPINLPAMKISGFVGFISPTANIISKVAAKLLTARLLSRTNRENELGFALFTAHSGVGALDVPLTNDLLAPMKQSKEFIINELADKHTWGGNLLLQDVLSLFAPDGSWWWPSNWKTSIGMTAVRSFLSPKIMQALKDAIHDRIGFELWLHLPTGDSTNYYDSKRNLLHVYSSKDAKDAVRTYVPHISAESESRYLVLMVAWDVDDWRWVSASEPSDESYVEVADVATARLWRKSGSEWSREELRIDLPTAALNLKDVLLRPAPRIFAEVSADMHRMRQWKLEWKMDDLTGTGCEGNLTVETLEARLLAQATATANANANANAAARAANARATSAHVVPNGGGAAISNGYGNGHLDFKY